MDFKNRRRLDLLILEDDDILLSTYSEVANLEYGLKVINFNSGLKAISYIDLIKNNNQLPLGYLVDMNINKGVIEQKTSEELSDLLKNRKADIDNFSFMTAHFSQSHDGGVILRTQMDVIIGKPIDEILRFYHNLAFKKLQQIPKGKIGKREGDCKLYELFKDLNSIFLNVGEFSSQLSSTL